MKYRILFFLVISSLFTQCTLAQEPAPTRQDSLRGSIGRERAWWDVLHYQIDITPDYATKTIRGSNTIRFFDKGGYTMQIDLQEPMVLDSARFENETVKMKRDGNVYWLYLRDSALRYKITEGERDLVLYFHGQPREGKNPPWDGGWIWKKDEKGRPWMSVAVQGLGASAWYPCKDHQSDEPDKGARFTINVPDTLVAVANGRMKGRQVKNGMASYTWEVKNPINNYNIVPYIGKYVSWKDQYKGEKGMLDCTYWVLDYNLEKGKKQFVQVHQTLKALETWFGPYPFYEDGFQLVEAPHLGMEHQSAVAYGNKFRNGYGGTDLSGTGWGLKWDFIIVHEMGHEWFGNNVTSKDIADMWIHEGFTNYSETLFTDYYYGKEAGNEYVQGLRKRIANDRPIIGQYGINREGSGDMYYKGSNLVHTIRQLVDDDKKFRTMLREINSTWYHKTLTSAELEKFISKRSGKNLTKVFDQYLRTSQVPVLELKVDKSKIKFQWTNCIEGFNMPVKLTNGEWIYPTTDEQKIELEGANFKGLTVDPNFYITVKLED